MFLIYIVLFCVKFIDFSLSVDMGKCVNGPQPLDVIVAGCDNQPCKLPRNSTIDFNIIFLASTSGLRPIQVTLVGCNKQPCPFIRSKDAIFTIKFEANNNMTSLTASVLAYAAGVQTRFHLPDENACSWLIDGECPIDQGEVLTYAYRVPVLAAYPKISVIVEYYLISDTGIAACFRLNCFVVDP